MADPTMPARFPNPGWKRIRTKDSTAKHWAERHGDQDHDNVWTMMKRAAFPARSGQLRVRIHWTAFRLRLTDLNAPRCGHKYFVTPALFQVLSLALPVVSHTAGSKVTPDVFKGREAGIGPDAFRDIKTQCVAKPCNGY